MGYVDSLFEAASDRLGLPPDPIKLIALLIVSVPLSIPLAHFPANSNLIHLYSIALQYLFHTQVFHLHSGFNQLVGQSVGTWLTVKYLRSTHKGKPWYWAVFIANMAVLTTNQIVRYYGDIPLDVIEITGTQMVLTMKLSLFAWAAYDGGRPTKDLDPVQKRDRLESVPGLLPFLGYCFFLPSILIGPSFTYEAYAGFVDRSVFSGAKEISPVTGLPAGRWRKAIKRFGIASFYLAVYAVYSYQFSYERLLEPDTARRTMLYKFFFTQIAGFLARTRYYAAWDFSESGMIISGLAYDPDTGKWTRGRNVMIRQIETAQSYKVLLDAWNCGTNYWLRECVYKRLAKPGRKPGFKSTMATFVTSAFWHGMNPTYYMTFILGGFLQSIGKQLRKNLRPFFLPPNYAELSVEKKRAADTTPIKRFYDLLSWIAVQTSLNFTVMPFLLLEIRPTLQAWATVHYYGLFMIFLPFAFFQFGGGKVLRSLQTQRAQKAGVHPRVVDRQRAEAARSDESDVSFDPNLHEAAVNELKKRN